MQLCFFYIYCKFECQCFRINATLLSLKTENKKQTNISPSTALSTTCLMPSVWSTLSFLPCLSTNQCFNCKLSTWLPSNRKKPAVGIYFYYISLFCLSAHQHRIIWHLDFITTTEKPSDKAGLAGESEQVKETVCIFNKSTSVVRILCIWTQLDKKKVVQSFHFFAICLLCTSTRISTTVCISGLGSEMMMMKMKMALFISRFSEWMNEKHTEMLRISLATNNGTSSSSCHLPCQPHCLFVRLWYIIFSLSLPQIVVSNRKKKCHYWRRHQRRRRRWWRPCWHCEHGHCHSHKVASQPASGCQATAEHRLTRKGAEQKENKKLKKGKSVFSWSVWTAPFPSRNESSMLENRAATADLLKKSCENNGEGKQSTQVQGEKERDTMFGDVVVKCCVCVFAESNCRQLQLALSGVLTQKLLLLLLLQLFPVRWRAAFSFAFCFPFSISINESSNNSSSFG